MQALKAGTHFSPSARFSTSFLAKATLKRINIYMITRITCIFRRLHILFTEYIRRLFVLFAEIFLYLYVIIDGSCIYTNIKIGGNFDTTATKY